MNLLRILFNLPQKNGSPSHEDIQEKISSIREGTDLTSSLIHDQKNIYAKDLLRMKKQVKVIHSSAITLSQKIDTALAIALAVTGDKDHKFNKSRKRK